MYLNGMVNFNHYLKEKNRNVMEGIGVLKKLHNFLPGEAFSKTKAIHGHN